MSPATITAIIALLIAIVTAIVCFVVVTNLMGRLQLYEEIILLGDVATGEEHHPEHRQEARERLQALALAVNEGRDPRAQSQMTAYLIEHQARAIVTASERNGDLDQRGREEFLNEIKRYTRAMRKHDPILAMRGRRG